MATNTLNGLVPVIYEALDVVARELVGFIPSVQVDAASSTAAVGQTVRSFVTPTSSAVDITPGVTSPDTGAQDLSNYVDMTISKAKAVPVQWSGEEQLSVQGQYSNILRDQFAQAFRTLTNAVEADLYTAAVTGASRAAGTAGTTPFGTAGDLSDIAKMAQILDDNGAPIGDRQFIFSNASMASLRGKQSVLFKVNEAGTDQFLRQGILGQLMGFNFRQSGAIKSLAAGTGSGYVLNGANAAGSSTVAVKTGTGTIVAGDVVTVNGTKYVVNSALGAGSLGIGAPGLVAAGADGDAVALAGAHESNIALHKGALVLLARAPAMPAGGDAATDVMTVTDPFSGLSFQVAMYKQYRRTHIEIALAWGTKCVKPQFVSVLMG